MKAPDPNLEALIKNWDNVRGHFAVFLGAGASKDAMNVDGRPVPDAYELRNDLWTEFKFNDPGKPFDPADLKLMSLEHAAAIIEARTKRKALRDYLVKLFNCDKPLWPHLALPHLGAQTLFTTNYDELVELAYASRRPLLQVICNNQTPLPERTALYKPHGSLGLANQQIGSGGLVITQFDYFDMIIDYRAMLQNSLTGLGQKCVLIIGYSFGDMEIGAELYSIRKKNRDIPWYAVFPRDDPQVRNMYSTRLGIEQIDRTFEEFLAEIDARVGFLPAEVKFSRKADMQRAGIIQ